MRDRLGRRPALAVACVAAAGVLLSSAASPSFAGGHSEDATIHGKIIRMLRHMTVEEKVGQLFVVEVYGQDADTVSSESAARNQALYGVDTPAQVIGKYK